MSELKKIDITIRINSIKTLKFSVNNTDQARQLDRNLFQFNIAVSTFIHPPTHIIGFDVIQDIFLDKEMTNKVSELISRMEFELVNFDEVVKKDEAQNSVNVPDQVMMMLLSISLSTARGIFASKVEGSALEGVYTPILDPTKFVKNPLQKESDERRK